VHRLPSDHDQAQYPWAPMRVAPSQFDPGDAVSWTEAQDLNAAAVPHVPLAHARTRSRLARGRTAPPAISAGIPADAQPSDGEGCAGRKFGGEEHRAQQGGDARRPIDDDVIGMSVAIVSPGRARE
jgi:hypothetical protein